MILSVVALLFVLFGASVYARRRLYLKPHVAVADKEPEAVSKCEGCGMAFYLTGSGEFCPECGMGSKAYGPSQWVHYGSLFTPCAQSTLMYDSQNLAQIQAQQSLSSGRYGQILRGIGLGVFGL